MYQKKFLEHVNSIDPYIQFTTEETQADGYMPSLDTKVISESDRTLPTSIYRKPTLSDQYLHWHNHHNFAAKYSVFISVRNLAYKYISKEAKL